jgi:hypothetical protein
MMGIRNRSTRQEAGVNGLGANGLGAKGARGRVLVLVVGNFISTESVEFSKGLPYMNQTNWPDGSWICQKIFFWKRKERPIQRSTLAPFYWCYITNSDS